MTIHPKDLAPYSSDLNDMGGEQPLDDLRNQVAAGLSRSFSSALESYRRFNALCAPDNPRSYVAQQSGCRAALAHIHLLIKLAEWAERDRCTVFTEAGHGELDHLLSEARMALSEEDKTITEDE